MSTKFAGNLGGDEGKLTHDERITLSLLRVVTDLATIRKGLTTSDFQRLPSLPALLQAADRLIDEMGFSDDE